MADDATGDKKQSLAVRWRKLFGREPDIDVDAPPAAGGRSKRREQVLRAQRTHRQRIQRYIDELEREVLRLRSTLSHRERRVQALEREVVNLQNLLLINNIPVPESSVAFSSPSAASPLSQENMVSSEESFDSPINVDLTGRSQVSLPAASPTAALAGLLQAESSSQAAIDPDLLMQDQPDPQSQIGMSPGPSGSSRPSGKVLPDLHDMGASELSPENTYDAQQALDFVLALERPCLPHIRESVLKSFPASRSTGEETPDKGKEPEANVSKQSVSAEAAENTGLHHVFTVTANLTYNYRSLDPSHNAFQASTQEIERLLNFSRRLELEDEVTPIQIWATTTDLARPKGHLGRFKLDEQIFLRLKSEFCAAVRCNSFGAVVDKDVARTILSKQFSSV